MMQKIQRFGGAMFTPVLLFAFAGVIIGFGTLFTTEVIMGPIHTDATSDQKFFLIPHGVTTTITATATGVPIATAFTVGISAFYTAPFGMYSDDFSIGG